MEDKELIKLAAKAYNDGYFFGFDKDGNGLLDPVVYCPFNPLTDDGDALRLAVTLGMDVSHDEIGMKSFVYVRSTFNDERHVGLSEVFDDETKRLERTRRAITRAAAQIGKEME